MKIIKRFFLYSVFSNLFFERAIFILYLQHKGCDIYEIALWQAVINVFMMIGEIPTGVISDAIGKKKGILLGELCILTYYGIMFGTTSFDLYLVAAALFGLGSTFLSGTNEALLYDLIENEERAEKSSVELLGKYSAVVTISIGIAMVLGGIIQKITWETIMAFGGIARLVAIVFLLSIDVNERSEKRGSVTTVIRSLVKKSLSDSFIPIIALFLGLYSGVVSAIYLFGQNLFETAGFTTLQISIVYMVETVISAYVFGSVLEIRNFMGGNTRSLLLLLPISGVAMLGIAFTNKWVIVVSILLISFICNYAVTVLLDIYLKSVDSMYRASAISMMNIVSSLIMSIIFMIIGKLGDEYVSFLMVMGVVSVIALIVCVFFYKRRIDA